MCCVSGVVNQDVVYRSETLKNVLASVTYNGRQLVMTGILVIVTVYLYTIISFNFYRYNSLLRYIITASIALTVAHGTAGFT